MSTLSSLKVKAELPTRRQLLSQRDDGSGRAAEYESMLDLFTLISFILIMAAFLYIAGVKGQYTSGSEIVAKIAQPGAGPSKTLPEDMVLMVLYKKDGNDMLKILGGGSSGQRIVTHIDAKSAKAILTNSATVLKSTKKINFAIDDSLEEANRFLAIAIQDWLAENNVNYHFYHNGKGGN